MIAVCIVKMAHSARRIALIYDARLTYDLKVMTGVAAYLQEGHHYSVFIEENALKDQRCLTSARGKVMGLSQTLMILRSPDL